MSVSGEVSATVTKYRTVDEDGKIVGERIEGSATAKIQGESKVNKVGNVEYRTSGFSAVEESKSYSDSSTIFNVTGLPPYIFIYKSWRKFCSFPVSRSPCEYDNKP